MYSNIITYYILQYFGDKICKKINNYKMSFKKIIY